MVNMGNSVKLHKRDAGGWVCPTLTIKANKKDIINECIEPQPYWDDWTDYRDGIRMGGDRSKIKSKNSQYARWHKKEVLNDNAKLKRMIKIRKAKKSKYKSK